MYQLKVNRDLSLDVASPNHRHTRGGNHSDPQRHLPANRANLPPAQNTSSRVLV